MILSFNIYYIFYYNAVKYIVKYLRKWTYSNVNTVFCQFYDN